MTTTTKLLPETLSDFRKLGKKRLRGTTPEDAKAKHDARQKIDLRPPVTLSWWLRHRSKFLTGRRPRIATLPLPTDARLPKIPNRHARKRNWEGSRASVFATDISEANKGPYSSRCRYIHYAYTHWIECWGAIVGRYLVWRIDTAEGVKTGKIKAFRGWKWRIDKYGICMARGKAEYHPDADELLSGITSSEIARLARENHQRRIADQRKERQLQRSLPMTRVTLHDARVAGNCLAGTVRFCQDRLGIRVRSDNPYQSINAAALLATGDPSAARAVYAAYQRETMVSI